FDIVSQRDHCCRRPSGSCKYITKPALYFSKFIPKSPQTPSEPFLKLPSNSTVCPHRSYFFENCGGLKKTHAYKRCELCIYEKHNILARFTHPGGGPGQGGGVAYKNKGAVDEGLWANKNSQVDAWELCG
ncbi:hypothetical protein, partial [Pseudobutyrivibrio sp.]|uniref:hypothetical protein n=1 Tax=Pseudobutyrivibrio sp. TaxID=2014367 RepID=UPI0025F97A48